eukprot:gnl/TRDRNA2_/TRDRNA2_121215_c0_seq2.p1 gnl/TRDRNA2_/TRDRNA2_121215_c0~~gnl/TRDRNA2_/TRDRNA2_121215_c0_seq2.p1  ORF type:complete len:114 (+),score=13.70 gnl/TRDRNA2_/TRDRNA2_121215_c0_seq2:578-919(+)
MRKNNCFNHSRCIIARFLTGAILHAIAFQEEPRASARSSSRGDFTLAKWRSLGVLSAEKLDALQGMKIAYLRSSGVSGIPLKSSAMMVSLAAAGIMGGQHDAADGTKGLIRIA